MIKKPNQNQKSLASSNLSDTKRYSTKTDEAKPFLAHIHELRNRIVWSLLALLVGSGVSYGIHQQLTNLIQKPLNKTLYFTSPAGGLNFLVKLCITFGIIFALPVVLFQIVKFFYPLLEKQHKKAVLPYLACSVVLAYSGVLFGYFVSLPNALQFLSSFGGPTVDALITVDEYYNFVLAYLLGFALLFQLPIIVLFMNRIKPLKPGSMMGAQRYIILGSFVLAAILTPTPDPINQTIMALPAVILYQASIFLVWWVNRRRKVIPQIVLDDIPADVIAESALAIEVLKQPIIKQEPVQPVRNTFINPSRPVSDFIRQPRAMVNRPKISRPAPMRPAGSFMDIVLS